MTRRLRWAVFVCLTSLHAAAETGEAEARALFEVGAQAYAAEDYAAAIEAFEAAYRHDERPGLTFSLAQAHRRAYGVSHDGEHAQKSLDYYKKYLKQVPEGGRRGEALRAVSELEPVVERLNSPPESGWTQPAPQTARLMIACRTPGALLSVDGDPVPRLPYIASVTPGRHEISARAQGFAPYSQVLETPSSGIVALNVELEELPATIQVSGPRGAELVVDGRSLGSLPVSPLRVTPGWHQVALRRTGYRVTSTEILLDRGETRKVALTLESSTQRQIAWALIGGGVAGLGVSAGLLTVALVQHEKAEDILERRDQQSISAVEQAEYAQARGRFEDYRTASIVTGATGAALAAAGAVLYLTDAPGQLPAPAHAEPTAPSRSERPFEVDVQPQASAATIGASVRVRF